MVSTSFQAPQMPVLPDMPTAFGAVLQRVSAAMMAPSGLFGRGTDWREGATLATGFCHWTCLKVSVYFLLDFSLFHFIPSEVELPNIVTW